MIWLDEGGRQRGLRLIVPPPRLRDDVEHFWIQETMPKKVWRIVPDINAYAIFSMTHENERAAYKTLASLTLVVSSLTSM